MILSNECPLFARRRLARDHHRKQFSPRRIQQEYSAPRKLAINWPVDVLAIARVGLRWLLNAVAESRCSRTSSPLPPRTNTAPEAATTSPAAERQGEEALPALRRSPVGLIRTRQVSATATRDECNFVPPSSPEADRAIRKDRRAAAARALQLESPRPIATPPRPQQAESCLNHPVRKPSSTSSRV